LILEQLARNRIFLGHEGLAKVRGSFIVVVGCGGVGSWAATMLVRSGVGKIRFVDFDQVTLSSLNRHAVATLADVGTPKVLALRKHLEQVAPWVEIDARNELWNQQNGESLLDGNPTFVVDAIDNIDTKVDLLYHCKTRGIPVISSMGAGCKSDPTRVSLPTMDLNCVLIKVFI
jgi:tRNA A37 threonylcarbamoyladenosine dehydratase